MQPQHPSFLSSEFILVFLISLSHHWVIFIYFITLWPLRATGGNTTQQSTQVGSREWEEFNSIPKSSSSNIFPDRRELKGRSMVLKSARFGWVNSLPEQVRARPPARLLRLVLAKHNARKLAKVYHQPLKQGWPQGDNARSCTEQNIDL